MTQFIEQMRVGRKSSLLQFQKGILLSNKSLTEMFSYIQRQYSSETFQIEYIITRWLNQDILENLFSYLKMMDGGNDHPTPIELKNRLKWYILGKHSASAISQKENTEGDIDCTHLIDIKDTHFNNLNNPTCSQFSIDKNKIMIEEEEEEEEILINSVEIGLEKYITSYKSSKVVK